MPATEIPADLWERLNARAASAGVSVADLLTHLLDAGEPSAAQASQNFLTEARLRSIMTTESAYVVRTDMEGRFTYVNPAWARAFGWMTDNFIGAYCLDSVLPDDHTRTLEAVEACLRHPEAPVQVMLRKPGPRGETLYTLWEFVAVVGPDGSPQEIQCIGFDTTAQVIAENALRESEARYRVLTEMSSDYAMSVLADEDGRLRVGWVTGGFERVTGYSNPQVSIVITHPDDRPRVMADITQTLAGKPTSTEQRIVHANGQLVWVRVTRQPQRDDSGRIIGYYCVVEDINERRKAEALRLAYEQTRARLHKEQAFNAGIQRVLSALAHDVRTPLAVILNAAEVLSRYAERLDQARRDEKLRSIQRQTQYLINLLNDAVYAFTGTMGGAEFRPAPVNLETLCQLIIAEMQSTTADHPLRLVVRHAVGTVNIDETLVTRILLNLLSNAIKFSPPHQEVTLELDKHQNTVILRVIDQGIGISEADQEKIFDPFFRAGNAQEVEGTGLGLSIVRQCVTMHGGMISVYSQPGAGTTIVVELPAAA